MGVSTNTRLHAGEGPWGAPNNGAGIFRYYDLGCYEFQGSSNDTVPPTVLTVSSLPPDGGTTDTYFTTITVTFSEPMDYTAATSPANYELLAAGGVYETFADVRQMVGGMLFAGTIALVWGLVLLRKTKDTGSQHRLTDPSLRVGNSLC